MKKISGSTFYYKRLFPTAWFGFLAFFFITTISGGAVKESITFFIAPIFMGIFGFILFKKMLWDLADEVFDDDSSLIFRKGEKQQRVYLKDIVNVSYTQLTSPERITILTRKDGDIGKELVFSPPMRFDQLFSKNKLAIDLIDRVDNARNT